MFFMSNISLPMGANLAWLVIKNSEWSNGWHLLTTHRGLGTILRTWHVLIHIETSQQQFYPHFTDEEMEVRAHGEEAIKSELETRPSGSNQ